jgi:hypothetical protein
VVAVLMVMGRLLVLVLVCVHRAVIVPVKSTHREVSFHREIES